MILIPRWKSIVLGISVLLGVLYTLPNLYSEKPAVQITALTEKTQEILRSGVIQQELDAMLSQENLGSFQVQLTEQASYPSLVYQFKDLETQIRAQSLIEFNIKQSQQALSDQYSVALNLVSDLPRPFRWIGAAPMKRGLDLKGGVRFLMAVDLDRVVALRLQDYGTELRNQLRLLKIRPQSIRVTPQAVQIYFNAESEKTDRKELFSYLQRALPNLEALDQADRDAKYITVQYSETGLQTLRSETLEQTLTIFRNRVNELGVAEAVVQRQGLNHIVIELPGIQDTGRAKNILGKTATLEFALQEDKLPIPELGTRAPPGTRILLDRQGRKVLIKKDVILTGESITYATTGLSGRDNRPVVMIQIGGPKITRFQRTTQENIGKLMAIIYREDQRESVISLAVIKQALLGTQFEISGLNQQEASDLALLLRAGAMPAPTTIVEERIIGPSMGQENIQKGFLSLAAGLASVFLFMTIYYRTFGLISNLALLMNLFLLMGSLSLLGATLTLPGIAGIVLTLGMAVDANVLIFERIREELRTGLSNYASIQRGFDLAFRTIVDSNVTTLIVGLILFTMGTGPVKGFAVTLCFGILTSMFTAVTGTQVLLSLWYSRQPHANVKHSIGL